MSDEGMTLEEFMKSVDEVELDEEFEELAQSEEAQAAALSPTMRRHLPEEEQSAIAEARKKKELDSYQVSKHAVNHMVKSYKNDYVEHLKSGFKLLLSGLQELAQEEEQRMQGADEPWKSFD